LHTAGRPRDEGTMVLEGVPLDSDGKPLVRHDLWRKAGGRGQRVIFPGHADKQSYRFQAPATTRGPLSLTADLDYRRYRQEFLNLVVPDMERESGVYQPTVTGDSATCRIELVAASAPPPATATNGAAP
jgi:hypothetical protein